MQYALDWVYFVFVRVAFDSKGTCSFCFMSIEGVSINLNRSMHHTVTRRLVQEEKAK